MLCPAAAPGARVSIFAAQKNRHTRPDPSVSHRTGNSAAQPPPPGAAARRGPRPSGRVAALASARALGFELSSAGRCAVRTPRDTMAHTRPRLLDAKVLAPLLHDLPVDAATTAHDNNHRVVLTKERSVALG